jgi:predicted phage terminase large subunit-like protein
VVDNEIQLKTAQLKAARRALALKEARDNLLTYMRLINPHPDDPDDVTKSTYEVTPQARLLCQIFEQVERGEKQYVAVSISPQMGKSEVLTRGGPAWATGRNPRLNLMVGSYNQDLANEFGDDVRRIVTSTVHKQIFPEHELRKGGAAKDLLQTTKKGKTAFVGVGGSGTGKPADRFLVDDPVKSDEEAQSPVYRERIWRWFNRVAMTRCTGAAGIIIVHCMTGDTPVLMADGTEKNIADVRAGERVLSYVNGEHVSARVTAQKSQGEDDVFEIRTGNSRVCANARHPFLVDRGGKCEWVTTSALRVGDRIVSSAVTAYAGAKIDEEEAWLLGFMFGDGWLTRRDSMNGKYPRKGWVTCAAFSKNEDENALFEVHFRRKFGFVPKRTRFGYWRTEKQAPGKWFAEHGLIGRAKTKRIPDWLFSCKVEVRRAFLAGYLHADGTIDKKRQSTVASANEKMLRQVRNLCRSVGHIPSNVHHWSGRVQPPNSPAPVLSNIYSCKWGEHVAASPFVSTAVRSITPCGRAEVFDIQVEGAENFIADGLVTHNTRWHEDDLIGRLCDPEHPERNKKYKNIADGWTYINIPAVITDPKLAAALDLTLEVQKDPLVVEQFGKKPMASLWSSRFPLPFLARTKLMDPQGFSALRMGKPTPDDGIYFKADDLVEYKREELPPLSRLRIYGASDHATTKDQQNDPNVIGCVGVDSEDDIWVLPDLVWDRMETDQVVDELLLKFKTYKPLLWWMEDENISKSFGPFLYKRMREEKVYTSIDPVPANKDKVRRSRAVQGRIQMRKVKFPGFAHWWPDAKAQMLRFPAGKDDFVDWLAHIGQGLLKEIAPAAEKQEKPVAESTIQLILRNSLARNRTETAKKAVAGW